MGGPILIVGGFFAWAKDSELSKMEEGSRALVWDRPSLSFLDVQACYDQPDSPSSCCQNFSAVMDCSVSQSTPFSLKLGCSEYSVIASGKVAKTPN